MGTINWEDFSKIDIRVGTVLDAEDFPQAKQPAYRLFVDFGIDFGIKKCSAQITRNYSKEQLIGRQVVAVLNFPPKQIANLMSECLVLAVVGEETDDVVLLRPDSKVKNGYKVS